MNSKRPTVERPKLVASKLKKILSQCCAVSGPNLLMLSFGMSVGFSTVLIPALYRKDAEIVVTEDELSWISSINFFVLPVGALVAGPLADRVGRKPIMCLATVCFLLGWVQLHWWATSAWTLMLAFTLLGVASGVTDSSGYIYTSEISEIRYRGTLLTSLTLALTLGVFLQVLIGNYLHWRTCALVDAAFSLLTLAAIFVAPESPQWHVNQGRLPEAEGSLRWLRGWTDSSNVKLEFDSLVQSSVSRTPTRCSAVQSLFRREVLLPFILTMFLFLVSCFNGSSPLLTYSVLVFEKIESPMDEYEATIVLSALQVLAPAILMFAIKRTGKRLPTLGSLLVSGLALLGVAVYVYLREQDVIRQDGVHSWIPMTLVLLMIFVSCCGIAVSPWILSTEVFPVEVRGLAIGILGSACNVFVALANKSLLYMLDGLTLPGTFAFFAAVNFLGLVALYRTMPETEGKSSAEIQQFFQKKSGALPRKNVV